MFLIENLAENQRITVRKNGNPAAGEGGCVIYWMQKSQRAVDNYALDTAVEAALKLKQPAAVFFNLVKSYLGSSARQYSFMIEGLVETAGILSEKGIGFYICVSDNPPEENIALFLKKTGASIVVCDENPLLMPSGWREKLAEIVDVPFITVDADTVVPSKLFTKEEYSARTLRLKITPLIEQYLVAENNTAVKLRWNMRHITGYISNPVDIPAVYTSDNTAPPVSGFKGGSSEALKRLEYFVKTRLESYAEKRNKPEEEMTSRLSPYIHFGHISPVRIALTVKGSSLPEEKTAPYLEELIVRRELAVNYTLHNRNYNSLEGCHEWAKKSLRLHLSDLRPYLYSFDEFENALTHDEIWNAAQKEMTETGFMHSYMRMYWAKKILEWSRSPEEAFETALTLNDRYQLDGRDPNSYTGIAWAIGGKHDRPWGPERKIFGLIRYMNDKGLKRKFDTAAYVKKYS